MGKNHRKENQRWYEDDNDISDALNIETINNVDRGVQNNKVLLNSWLINAGKENWEYEKKEIKKILGTDDWVSVNHEDIEFSTLKKFSTDIKHHDIFIYNKQIKNNKDSQPFSGKIDGIPYYWTQVFFAKSLFNDMVMLCRVKDANKLEDKIRELNSLEDIDLPYDKIILGDGIKDKFYKSTFGFIENIELRKKFKKHYMRFKRSILLSGPPGNGKTSLVTWLRARAEEKDWKIFNWENLNSEEFRYRDKMCNTLFILEDIDQIMTQRDGTIYNNKGTGFSQILNLLDGSEAMDNYIVVMTTNYPDLLDKALLRDGRTDERIHIDYPTKELKLQYIDAMIKPILSGLDISKLNKFIDDDKVSFSTLDNLRKKIFIYESLDKALETFIVEERENKKQIGFEKDK